PGLAYRCAGRCGAGPEDRDQPDGRALPAMPLGAVSAGTVPGEHGAGPERGRFAFYGRTVAVADRRWKPDQSGYHHDALLPGGWPDPGGAGFPRQADPDCGADRGCGGVPDDAEGLRN